MGLVSAGLLITLPLEIGVTSACFHEVAVTKLEFTTSSKDNPISKKYFCVKPMLMPSTPNDFEFVLFASDTEGGKIDRPNFKGTGRDAREQGWDLTRRGRHACDSHRSYAYRRPIDA